jgi:hypothetical protein
VVEDCQLVTSTPEPPTRAVADKARAKLELPKTVTLSAPVVAALVRVDVDIIISSMVSILVNVDRSVNTNPAPPTLITALC